MFLTRRQRMTPRIQNLRKVNQKKNLRKKNPKIKRRKIRKISRIN